MNNAVDTSNTIINGLHLGKLLCILLNKVSKAQQEVSALAAAHRSPRAGERRARSLHGQI
jgi:hypothetical protein